MTGNAVESLFRSSVIAKVGVRDILVVKAGRSAPELGLCCQKLPPGVPGPLVYEVLTGACIGLWLPELCSEVLNPETMSATNLASL